MEANVRCNVVSNQILCNHLVEISNITDERVGDFFERNCMVSHVIIVLRDVLYLKLSCKYLYFLVSLLSLHCIKEETICKEDSMCYVCWCVWLFFLHDIFYPEHHVGNSSGNLCDIPRHNQKIISFRCSFRGF